MADCASSEVSSEEAIEAFYAALLDDDPEALYERAPCGYLSTTPDGTIVKVNDTFLTLTGYGRDELIGRRRFAELLTGGGRIYHETHYAPMLQMHGAVREIALEIVLAGGGRLPVLLNSVLERDGSGAPAVIRTAVFDATHRRDYERELLAAKRRAEESEARATLLAQTLQQALIPPAPPDIPGLDIAATYRPAGAGEEVGGDFYDVFELGGGDWMIAIGDVSGKGVEAAAVTALARHTIRAAAVRTPQPAEILDTLNQVLVRHPTDRFCTIALVRIQREAEAWSATLGSGGHPLPVLVRAGTEPAPAGRSGRLLGAFADASFADVSLEMLPGDVIVLYTDGVTEGRSGSEFYGEERLQRTVEAHPAAAAIVSALVADVLAFQHDNPRDDIAVVAVGVPLGP